MLCSVCENAPRDIRKVNCDCGKNTRPKFEMYCSDCSKTFSRCERCGVKVIIHSTSGQQINKITEPSCIIQRGSGQQINFF